MNKKRIAKKPKAPPIPDKLRTCRFRPYRSGPIFTLTLWYQGTDTIGYTLSQGKTVIFEGADFCPSPMHSVDGDDAVNSLMTFLTLRNGDTEAEYFDKYTPAQLEFSEQHAEALSACVDARFRRNNETFNRRTK